MLQRGFRKLTVDSGLEELNGDYMPAHAIRVLVVEDSEPFRKFICSTLGERPELQIVGEVSDGLEAVHKAKELQPGLIVLDIGLPSLNGIEAARQIRKLSPESKILFISQESSADMVQEALGTGAHGYIVKIDARSELLTAVDDVFRGEYFVGRRFSGHDFLRASDQVASHDPQGDSTRAPLQRNMEGARPHEVGFYPDDRLFLADVAKFIGTALKRETERLLSRLSHTETLFFRNWRHMAWMLLPLFSRGDTSRWMWPTRSRRS